ncbi:hypothetical protein BDN72DRAFT_964572 [Pluteus cervinus]|uniref:Uncharacterized protein n=1 Tax=Pluteus cervinus TaxID=181527 RepID=A0ACD3A9Q9_9AGAR|nr:hypothetical protein BDN72DRAFT_964572 [Pluteus cervinus]
MKVFSNDENITYGPLFKVAYHTQCSPWLVEAQTQQVPLGKDENNSKQVIKHPSLDLMALFERVRNYGDLPSSPGVQAIEDLVQECKDDIRLLNSKLSDTISTISQLCRELSGASYRLTQLQDKLALGEYLLSGSRNTPTMLQQDSLEQIFLACLHSRDSYVTSPKRPPLQLAAVCHRWRAIALSMPKLWEDNYVNAYGPSSCNLAKTWISRCPSYLLTFQTLDWTQEQEHLLTFLETSHSKPRLLDIPFHDDHAGDVWPRLLRLDWTELQQLIFRGRLEVPRSASQLKRVYVSAVPQSWEITPPPSQLTVLCITSAVHWSMLEHILAHCHALQCLLIPVEESGARYSNSPSQGSGVISSKKTTLKDLKSFCFVNEYEDENLPANLLHTFSFPALSAFEYHVKQAGRECISWLTSLELIHHIRRLTLELPEYLTTLPPLLAAASVLEEISISCGRSNFEPLTEVFSSLRESPTRALCLRGVQFVSTSLLCDLEHESSFIELIRTVSSLAQITHLNIGSCYHHHNLPSEVFLAMLRGEERIKLKFFQVGRRHVPWEFETYTPSHSELQERDILQLDGTWKTKFGPVYRLVD